jgi:Cu/Ag efflux pump CusA
LFNFRTAFISALAIPVSLIGAVIVLLESGVNLNIMVLGGLLSHWGVVDDAIIDTENIFRRLRENRLLTSRCRLLDVVYGASLEVRSSVVYASFIVALVFVPLDLKRRCRTLVCAAGLFLYLAILMSLLVALTLTPALCYALLGNADLANDDPPLIKRIKPLLQGFVGQGFQSFQAVVIGSVIVCLAGCWLFSVWTASSCPNCGRPISSIPPAFPGTSLQESITDRQQADRAVMAVPGIQSVSMGGAGAERALILTAAITASMKCGLSRCRARSNRRYWTS